METIAFLELLVGALGRGWSSRYGMIAPYNVFGVTLTCDVGGMVEIVPSLVRGEVVTWSPFVFTRGEPHYDLHLDRRALVRTRTIDEAVECLQRWRRDKQPAGRVATLAARVAATRSRRAGQDDDRVRHVIESEDTPVAGLPAVQLDERDGLPAAKPTSVRVRHSTLPMATKPTTVKPGARARESLADALRGKKLGQVDRARRLARQGDRGAAARELLAIAKRASGDARANALSVFAAVARPEDGAELARYLADPERSVQHVAIDGVKRIGYAAAVPALAELVLARDGKSTSGRSRLAIDAASAMKVLSGKRGGAALSAYLTSEHARVREAACVAFTMLAAPGVKQARPLLERLLEDSDAKVAKAAKRALTGRRA